MARKRATRGLRAHAFAKINLTLRVVGVRPDGYHDLRTTFQSIALHDTLAFTRVRAGDVRIECDDPRCPVDRENLIWRAAERVWRASGRQGRPSGVSVRLVKRIPMQAGLGGGSSDAAAALRGFARLWGVKEDALAPLAADLGADVPFFLEGGTVLGLERGDLLFPLIDRPSSWVVLVLPPFGVSTVDAYRWWDETRLSGGNVSNDLQRPVAAHHPEIVRLVRALERGGASHAAMSGSGSAVFGCCDSRKRAESIATQLAGRSARTIVTRTLSRTRYQSLSRVR